MTSQVKDILIDQRQRFPIDQSPLRFLGEAWCTTTLNSRKTNRFVTRSTACYRGFVAKWEIKNSRLFLTDFKAEGALETVLGMAEVFESDSQFAFWFSGEISSPLGMGISDGYKPIHDMSLLWVIEHGRLLRRSLRINRVDPRNTAESTSCGSGNEGAQPHDPLYLLMDGAARSGALSGLTNFQKEQMQEQLMVLVEAMLHIKSTLVHNFDVEDDIEWRSLIKAWRYLNGQNPVEYVDQRE